MPLEYFPNGGGMGGWQPIGYQPAVPVYAAAQHQQGGGGGTGRQQQQLLMPGSGSRGTVLSSRYQQGQVPVRSGMPLMGPPAQISGAGGSVRTSRGVSAHQMPSGGMRSQPSGMRAQPSSGMRPSQNQMVRFHPQYSESRPSPSARGSHSIRASQASLLGSRPHGGSSRHVQVVPSGPPGRRHAASAQQASDIGPPRENGQRASSGRRR